MSQKEFHLVLFNDGGTGVAPNSWIESKNECWWPSKTSNITHLSSYQSTPGEKWTTEKMEIVRSFDTFKNAKKGLVRYEETSNFDTEDDSENGRKRRVKHKKKEAIIEENAEMHTDSEEEDLDLPPLTATLPQKAVDLEDNFASSSQKIRKVGKSSQSFDASTPKVLNQNGRVNRSLPVKIQEIKAPALQKTVHSTRKKHGTSSCVGNCLGFRFQRYMTRAIIQIRTNQARQKELLRQLLDRGKTNNKDEDSDETAEEELLQLPCGTVEELTKLELTCSEKKLYKKLVSTLRGIGGHNVKDCVKRMMKQTLLDFVAKEYSWIGGSGKHKFHCLTLTKAMFEAIKKNERTKDATSKDIEQAIKDHLRHAKARCMAKNNEMSKAAAKLDTATTSGGVDESKEPPNSDFENNIFS